MSARPRHPKATAAGSTALCPHDGSGDPIRPILVSGEGLAPDERERRRLEFRREWAGRLIILNRELTDALNPDGPLALDPGFPWLEWSATTDFTHPALRRHRYAYIFVEDGITLHAYSVDFLIRLKWVVELLRPLMLANGHWVPAFYEAGWTKMGGARELPAVFGAAVVPQVITLSRHCANDADLAYCGTHEMAHADQLLADRDDPEAHGEKFCARFGRYLEWVVNGPGADHLSDRENRWIRSYAMEDSYAPPTHPLGRSWQMDRDGHWLVCPHPVSDPPEWWSREDW